MTTATAQPAYWPLQHEKTWREKILDDGNLTPDLRAQLIRDVQETCPTRREIISLRGDETGYERLAETLASNNSRKAAEILRKMQLVHEYSLRKGLFGTSINSYTETFLGYLTKALE